MRSTLGGTTEGLAAPEVSSSARDATDAFIFPSSPVSPTHLRAHGIHAQSRTDTFGLARGDRPNTLRFNTKTTRRREHT